MKIITITNKIQKTNNIIIINRPPPMSTQQDLHLLQSKLTKLYQYTTRKKPTISLSQLPISSNPNPTNLNPNPNIATTSTNIQQIIAYVNTEIERESYLVDYVIGEYSVIVMALYRALEDNTAKYDELVKEHDLLLAKVEEEKEIIAAKDREFVNLQAVMKVLEGELQQSKLQFESLQLQYAHQLEPMKQKLLDEQFNSEKNLEFVSSIRQQNESINKVMRETYNEKTELKEEIARLNQKIKELQESLMRANDRIIMEVKRRQTAQQLVLNHQKLISELQLQAEVLKQQIKAPYGNNFNYELFSPPQDPEQQLYFSASKEQKVKLSQDVENRPLESKLQMEISIMQKDRLGSMKKIQPSQQPDPKQSSNLADLHLDKTISQTPAKSTITSKIKKNLMLDPYYCHYVLLSQTIKIEENEEEYFNIDIKPYYKQIISQKIPMFQWKQWILAKFREIVGRDVE